MTKYFRILMAVGLSLWLLAIPATSRSQTTSVVQRAQTTDVLTLQDATEEFLRRNLSLEAARFEIGVAEAERIGARLRPRPGLTFSAENLRISGPTPFNRLYEIGATVAQPIELGNRQGLRLEVADRTVAVAEARLTDVLRRRLFDLKRTYYEAVLARAIVRIARENREGFDELVRFNTARFEEGYIAEGELIKVRLERIKFDTVTANANLSFRQAAIQLLELLGASDYERATALDVSGSLEVRPLSLSLIQLRELALVNRPDVKVAESEIARMESVARLERSRAKGELTPYLGYKRVGVDNAVLAGVTVPLPFGNRNQGGIARAEAERKVAESNLRFARNRALAEVEAAYRAYETAREQVKAYEAGILDQANESSEISLAAYREGAAELITLVEAQRTRAEIRTNYFRALFDYHIAIFQLEVATGTDIKP
ncbi:MAG: TolC family protein [Pyrinomonadaceae bacterium]